MSRTNSKRARAIALMNANASKTMAEVLPMLAKELGVTESAARSFYAWIVKNKLAKGKVEAAKRGPKTKADKPVKGKADSAEAKAKNLAKIKEIAEKRKAKLAELEVEAPAFLTKSDLKVLV